jgi:2-polyprenyl-3-methyl-5-hydroxy-6-metoxy-1,4-benzoquinol methylase
METIERQQSFWNDWNAPFLDTERGEISRRQAEIMMAWLAGIGRDDCRILDVGCGSGWFSAQLARLGNVVATDLSDEVLAHAQQRWPNVRFVPGDFLSLPFEPGSFDVVVSLEVLSHVAEQDRFIRKIAELLRAGGTLMLATQNRPVLEHHCRVPPPAPGQLRRWVDRTELSKLVAPYFDIDALFSVTPVAQRGPRRLLTSSKINSLLRPVLGDALRDALEERDWGWTLMLRATKRPSQ